jgi:hypothetical protein
MDVSAMLRVQEAVGQLKATWQTALKVNDSTDSTPKPFQAVQDALMERLQEFQAWEADDSKPAPSWLAQVEEIEEEDHSPLTPKKGSTTEELARRERQRERQTRLKSDLKESAEIRRKYLAELRALRGNDDQAKQDSVAKWAFSRRKIQWRDNRYSLNINKNALEEVFIFDRKAVSAAGLLTAAAAQKLMEADGEQIP